MGKTLWAGRTGPEKVRKKLFSVTIDDCKVDTFSVGGHGGAGKDTSNTGVRVTHIPSGATGRCVDSRSQLQNKQDAFRRMAQTPEFTRWAKLQATQLQSGRTLDDLVKDTMKPTNLKIERQTADGWSIWED